jgi:hypothetical protein
VGEESASIVAFQTCPRTIAIGIDRNYLTG